MALISLEESDEAFDRLKDIVELKLSLLNTELIPIADMHILAPQVENLFRNIAKEVGGLTVTLKDDGSSMEKVLSSILSLPELLDCYDNDILFTFRGLLNEQAGANIRNEIAHGIISEYACSTGVCLYFGVAVIKLLSLTSVSCYQILKNSKKLKHFEVPKKDALKVIH